MRRTIIAVATAAVLFGGPMSERARAVQPCVKADEHTVRMEDRRTTREVERRIANDEDVAPLAERVRISTSEGIVTLSGTVTRDEDRLVLASLAESAPGVRRVDDRLEIAGSWREPPSASRAR